MIKKWIRKAIKKKGALREYVKRKYGSEGFTDNDPEKGKIKQEVLHELKKDGITGKRARLALTLRKIRLGKKEIKY